MPTMFKLLGVWRSLVARFVRDEEVAGSNPVHPDHCDVPRHMSAYVADFLGFWGGCFGSFVRFGFGVFQDICPFLVGRFCWG